jgi:uncharacterized iron-regulated membrane protein
VTGIVLWWPGIRKMARGWRVRRGRGRYALAYDLHKVIGMAAIPFLLMWAVTGAGFDLRQVGQVWYALLPGGSPAEPPEVTSTPTPGSSVSMAEARLIAARTLPDARLVSISVPDRGDPASAYSVWMSRGLDPYAHGTWPGTIEVRIDRYSGQATVTSGSPGGP